MVSNSPLYNIYNIRAKYIPYLEYREIMTTILLFTVNTKQSIDVDDGVVNCCKFGKEHYW